MILDILQLGRGRTCTEDQNDLFSLEINLMELHWKNKL